MYWNAAGEMQTHLKLLMTCKFSHRETMQNIIELALPRVGQMSLGAMESQELVKYFIIVFLLLESFEISSSRKALSTIYFDSE